MSITAYCGHLGHNNVGDEALFLATKRLFPDVEFTDRNHLSEYDTMVLGGGTLLPAYANISGIRANQLNAALGVGARDPEFWNRPFGMLDLGYHIGRTKYRSVLSNRFVNYLTKPVQEFVDSVELYDHYIGDDSFAAVGQFDFDYLGVRGPRTHQILSKYEIDHEVVGDTALILEPDSYHPEQQTRIGVTLRNGQYQWSKNGAYIDTVIEFCRKYADTYEFVFLPFYPPDIELNRRAANSIPNATFRDYSSYVDVESMLNELSHCDLVIGDKLHANVLSACAHTPFISLEYRPKNRDFAESIDMGAYNLRTDKLTLDSLEEAAEELLENQQAVDELRSNVAEKRGTLKSFSQKIASEL